MPVTNVSTYGSLQTLLQNMSQNQNTLNNDEEEISSGETSQTFDGLGGSIEQFTALNAQVARLQAYQQNNTTYVSQLDNTNTVLTNIQQLATSINTLIAGQTGTGNAASFVQQLQSDLTTLTGQLNSTYAGNYLFSGTATNTAPVKTPLPTSSAAPGTPDNSYYQGSTQTSSVQISDTQSISNSITAADPSFQNLIAGIQLAISTAQAGNDDVNNTSSGSGNSGGLGGAEALISKGISGVIALGSTVNANIVTVNAVNSESATLQAYAQSTTESMSQSDVVALSTKVAQDQNVLEATFETFSRISSLTLANYLK